jgi:hypothetical protein
MKEMSLSLQQRLGRGRDVLGSNTQAKKPRMYKSGEYDC